MIEEVEKKLQNEALLYFNDHKKNDTIQEFFDQFFTLNDKHYTMDTEGEVQTPCGKYRSLADIYLLTKNYFPEVTLEQVMKNLTLKVTEKKLKVIWCPDIKKRVFTTGYVNSSFYRNEQIMHGKYDLNEEGTDELGFSGDHYLNLIK